MKTKKIILNYYTNLYMKDYDAHLKLFEKILNSFANANQKLFTKKYSKDVVEKMKKMNDESKFMPLTVFK